MLNKNGNGFIRDNVEIRAAHAVMLIFVIFACYTVYSQDESLLDMLAVFLYGEMRATTVGRGEGGTFEGEKHHHGKRTNQDDQ